jgi:hypothetical protein
MDINALIIGKKLLAKILKNENSQLWWAHRDNDRLKKAAAFFIRDNHLLN